MIFYSLISSLLLSQHFHNVETLLEDKDPVVKVFETHCMLPVPSSTLAVAFSRLREGLQPRQWFLLD